MSAKARGLGRGLDALLPKVDRSVQQIDIERLQVSELQPRKSFDEAAIAELAASVAEKGILQPLLVRPRDGKFEIIAGERRYRAAKVAGLSSVPAIVRELDDRSTLEIAIVENLQREDLGPLEEAWAYKRLLDFGMSQEKVAKAVGKSRSAVANSLRLLSLPPAALDALEKGTITAGHARAILAQPEKDRAWALNQIVSRGLSVREAEKLQRPKQRAERERTRPFAKLEEDLTRHTGAPVRITGRKRGRIELHFHSRDELEHLLELLGYRG